MKYSFVIITYEMKSALKNTLESLNRIKGVRRADFEVIVSDDGSTDDTFNYIQGVNRNYELKYIYNEKDDTSCRNQARNKGIKEARGDVIILMDGDILPDENILMEFERCYSLNKDIIVFGARIFLSHDVKHESITNGSIYSEYSFQNMPLNMLDDRYKKYNLLSYNSNAFEHSWLMAHTNIVAIPKAILNQVGLFDENIMGWGFDESELMFRIMKTDTRFVINHRIVVLHQPHTEVRDTPESKKVVDFTCNIEYFFQKHPEALNHLPINLAEYFMKDRMHELFAPPNYITTKIEMKLDNTQEVENIKKKILDHIDIEGLELTVVDEEETSDLDIWIQLLDRKQSIIKYFPKSKRLITSH